MANFKTHYRVGMLASIVPACGLFALGFVSFAHATLFFILSTFGSLLPDIDIPSSKIAKALFFTLSLFGSALFSTYLFAHFATSKPFAMYGSILVAFVLLQYFFPKMLTVLTRHRGFIHSIPMAVFLAMVLSLVCFYYFELNSFSSYLLGFSLGYGFIVHLLLDEAYSVNLMGARLKKSFGTAFKLYDKKEWLHSFLLYISLFVLSWFLPNTDSIWQFARKVGRVVFG